MYQTKMQTIYNRRGLSIGQKNAEPTVYLISNPSNGWTRKLFPPGIKSSQQQNMEIGESVIHGRNFF